MFGLGLACFLLVKLLDMFNDFFVGMVMEDLRIFGRGVVGYINRVPCLFCLGLGHF